MRSRALLTVSAFAAAAFAACQPTVPDGTLIGTWTSDDDPSTVLTLVANPGAPSTPAPDFSGTVVGELQSPSSPGRLLIDVRRDALGKPLLVIPAFSAQGFKDVLCEGCDVSSAGTMACDHALATTIDATGAVVTLGLSCSWTRTAGPVSCGSMSFESACPLASCPLWTGPRCGGGLCQAASVCTSASTCQCEPGVQLACCDGTPCPSTGCQGCSGGALDYGCAPSPPLACSDDVSGSAGVCHCAAGNDVSYSCGAAGTCDQICSGIAPDAGADVRPRDAGFVFDASLPEGGFPFDSAVHDASGDESIAPIDASPCSSAKCGGCCQGGFCYSGTSPTACGQLGQACVSCGGTGSCVSGACQ